MTRHEKLTLGTCAVVVIIAASPIYSCQSVAQEHGGQTLIRLARTPRAKSLSPALSQPSQPSTNSSAWQNESVIREANGRKLIGQGTTSHAGSNPAALTPPTFAPVIRTNRPPPVPMSVTLPDFRYPPNRTNYSWYVESSVDLKHWVTISWPSPWTANAGSQTNYGQFAPVGFYRLRGEPISR